MLKALRIGESGLRNQTGVGVIGVWDHGRLSVADRDTMIGSETVFILAGTREQIQAYNDAFSNPESPPPRVLIIGGGRVGRSVSDVLEIKGIKATIVEKLPERVEGYSNAVVGDATRMDVLKKAGVRDATTVIITTHDDDTNVALTIFFRKLRENWQILARSNFDRNVKTLSRAGADLVLSYASMGANAVFNLMRGGQTMLLAEGLRVFEAAIPPSVAGKKLGQSKIRTRTGSTVISVESEGQRELNPGLDFVLPEQGKMFLVGTLEAEDRFLEIFHTPGARARRGNR